MADWTRRAWIGTAGTLAAGAGLATGPQARANPPSRAESPFAYCLNTSTISGQKLPLTEMVELVSKAGYDAIEPWFRDLDAYEQGGGKLDDLGQRIADAGLVVPSAIGFVEWGVDDPAKRAAALEQARRDFARLKAIGGVRVAAPPVGLTDRNDVPAAALAERFAKLMAVGREAGVTPQVEVWGFSKTLRTLGEAAGVAIDCGDNDACVLADVYHLHKGGSAPGGLAMLNGARMHVFHMNDYPADPPAESITDAHRVYPGDGVAPLAAILRDLHGAGYRGVLSLELFNRDYWRRDAGEVVRTGLAKLKAAVAAAGLA